MGCTCAGPRLSTALFLKQGPGHLTARQNQALLTGTAQLDFTPRGENLAVHHAGFSVAVCREGRVFVWGDSAHGCLGVGHVQATFLPRVIPSLEGYVVRQVKD